MDQILPKTDAHSPFNTRIPNGSPPTEILSKRFELWRQILKSLIVYFKTLIMSNQQQIEINLNIVNSSINFNFFTDLTKVGNQYELIEPKDSKKQSFFTNFGNGSIQDLQILLKKYHLNLITQYKQNIKELSLIIQRLEDLQKDLSSKIKEIKQLDGDFNNSLNQEIANTGHYLNSYITIISRFINGEETDITEPKHDPFIKKFKLENQLKIQIHQENFLEEAFINLQITALELEKIVFNEIKESLNKFGELISKEIFIHYNDLINELHEGIISKKNYFEWDKFILRDNNKNLLLLKHDDKVANLKKLSDIKYPFNDSILSKTIRSGFLNKKSKLLKTYSTSFYVLTLNFLHEFKNDNLNENITPISSIKLNDCILIESNDEKFKLQVNSNNLIKTHHIVFKKIDSQPIQDFKKWIQDIKNLTSFSSLPERFEYLSNKLNSRSQTPSSQISPSPSKLDVSKMGVNTSILNNKLEALSMNQRNQNQNQNQNLSINSTLTQPSIEIQQPTPIRTQAPELPSIMVQPAPVSVQQPIPVNSAVQQPIPVNSAVQQPIPISIQQPQPISIQPQTIPVQPVSILRPSSAILSNNPSRVATPMIGEIGVSDYNNVSIDLNERLYKNDGNGVDLNALLSGEERLAN